MAILDRAGMPRQKIIIDLNGPAGNAFVLMKTAEDIGRQIGFCKKIRDDIKAQMMSGDHEYLLGVFDMWFGDYVDLYR